MLRFIVLLLLASIVFIPNTISQTISFYTTGEEFNGPFPNWKNVKTDFGAIGDGITDDAPAINAALYAFRDLENTNFSVLYFPAGTYKLCSTIYNADRAGGGTHYSGFGIVGEDPENTILLWDGPDDGTMFTLDGWYLKISRLTFEGQNRAKIGLFRDGGFGTGVEYSDLFFSNLVFGIQLGDFRTGQAENLFLRCRFSNCDVGIFGSDMNSLDTWVWYCLFEDCNWGIHLGGYHAYENVLLRSKVCDFGLSWQPSCLVNNISVHAERFTNHIHLGFFQGNKIYDPDTTVTSEFLFVDTIKAFKAPPVSVLLDNVIKTSGTSGAAVELSDGSLLSAGNTFTQSWPVRPSYRYARSPVREHIYFAVDENNDTYLGASLGYKDNPGGIKWHCPPGGARVANKYSVTAGHHYNLIPKTFRLTGSNNWGYTYTILDFQEEQFLNRGETRTYTFNNSNAYTIYRFEILETDAGNKPGSGGYFHLAEFNLVDSAGIRIINEPGGYLAGGDETWGSYYTLNDVVIPYDSIKVPEIIELPGTPPKVSRKTFLVRRETEDDASEIQMKIDSAAALPAGSRPIVYIPKGTYSINRTIFLPANTQITVIGDGIYNGATRLEKDTELKDPTLQISAPGKVLLRDIEFWGDEAIYVEVDDRPDSHVTGNLIFFGGIPWWVNMAEYAMIIDGIEHCNIQFTGMSFGCCYNGVLVKGGPLLSSGGSTNGQITFLGGGSSLLQNMWETQNYGKLIAHGVWFESDINQTKDFINLTASSSGSLAIAGMNWYHNPNPDRPIVSINNFSGQFTAVANSFSRWLEPHWWKIGGSGTSSQILSACNTWDLGNDSTAMANKWPYWLDESSPPIVASRMFCGVPDIVGGKIDSLPDSDFLISSLELIRSLKIIKPEFTDEKNAYIDFSRVAAFCPPGGTAIRFIASPDPYGRPSSPNLISPVNGSSDIISSPEFIWEQSDKAIFYRLQLALDPTFSNILYDDSLLTLTNHKLPINLMDNSMYYWRIKAFNSKGSSSWSRSWNFTTGTDTSVTYIENNLRFEFSLGQNYPNPFKVKTTIEYYVPIRGRVILKIYDYLGKELATLIDDEHIPGRYHATFKGNNLPGGIYLCKIISGLWSDTRKMVLIK